jgi:mannosyltransferase OCH1-like enzyme
MRSTVLILTVAVGTATIFYLRHHIHVLSEVFRTYSTFYPYLDTHPDVLYRYSEDDAAMQPSMPTIDESLRAPRMIHQIHLMEERPSVLEKYGAAIESCQNAHAGWNYTIWTDETSSAFMRDNYPTIFPHYSNYKQTIQRANILRYALLDHFGGVYIDTDVTCRRSLEPLRTIPWLTPAAHPAGVNNAFILSRPGHPFLKTLLAAVPSRDLSWGLPYIENMLSTGCMYFSNMWMSYARSIDQPGKAIDRLYILADQQGDINAHMLRGVVTTPLFKHGGASSWHGWDAAAIVLIGKYYPIILQGCLVMSLFSIYLLWRCVGQRNRRRRSSWGTMMKKAVSTVEVKHSNWMPMTKEDVGLSGSGLKC